MHIEVQPLGESNLPAAIAFVSSVLGRSESRELEDWRYRESPRLEGAVAMVGGDCVATMFGLRRTYVSAAGRHELIEPFEWHTSEEWRAQAPGFRLARFFMRGAQPLIGLPGTPSATSLLERLRWIRCGQLARYALPVTGRFLRSRGRKALVALGFDIFGRPLFTPRAPKRARLRLVQADTYPDGAADMAASQRQFSLMREPDAITLEWLRRAPEAVGRYSVLHAYDGRSIVGWALVREYRRGTLRLGEILEVFLQDDSRALYPELVAAVSAHLAGGVDGLLATSSSDDVIAACQAARFRPDERRELFLWWKEGDPPSAPILGDGAIADHSFFPIDTGVTPVAPV